MRLRPEDAAWVGLHHGGRPMVVEARLRLAGDLPADELARLVRDRALPRFPELADGAPDGVVERAVSSASGDAGPEQPLPARGWRMVVARGEDRTDVVVRFHHSLGDGVALLALLEALLDGDASPSAAERPVPQALRAAAGFLAVLPVGVGVLARSLGRRLPLPASSDAAWTSSHDLAALRAAARARSATVNDVLLAAVAGGLRSVLVADGAEPRDAHVLVPVDLRTGPVTRLGNRLGVVVVRLPVSASTADERLSAVRRRTRHLRRSPQPQATWLLLRLVGRLPPVLAGAAGELLGASVDGLVTNVRGPREVRTLAGRRLVSLRAWVPRIGAARLGVSLVSSAGEVVVGVAGVPAAVAAAVDAELAGWVTASGVTRSGE